MSKYQVFFWVFIISFCLFKISCHHAAQTLSPKNQSFKLFNHDYALFTLWENGFPEENQN